MPGSARKGRKPDGYWGHFNLWWRGFHEETGTRPKVSDIESWCESTAYTAAWPDGDGPTVEQAVTHSKGMRPLAEVRRYFVEYRQKKALQRKAGQTRRRGRADPESDDPDYCSQPAEGAQSKDQGDDDLGQSGAEDDAGSDSYADQRLEQRTAPSAPKMLLGPQPRPNDGVRGAARGGANGLLSGVVPFRGTPLSRHAQSQLMLLHEVLYGSMLAAATRPTLVHASPAKGIMGDTVSDHHEMQRPSGSAAPVNAADEALIDAKFTPLGSEHGRAKSRLLKGSQHCTNGGSNVSAPASALARLRPKVPGGEERSGIRSCNGMQSELADEGQRQFVNSGHEKDDDDDWMPFANCLGPTSPDGVTQLLKHTGGPSPGTSLLGILHPAAPRRDSSMARAETGPEPCSVLPSVPAPGLQDLQPLIDPVVVASNTSAQTAALAMLRPTFPGGKERGSMSKCGSMQCDWGQDLRHLSVGSAGSYVGEGGTGDARGRLASLAPAASAQVARRPAESQLQPQHTVTVLETVTPPSGAAAAPAVVAQEKESARKDAAGAGPERQCDLPPPPPKDRVHLQSERCQVRGSAAHGDSWDALKSGTLGKRPSEASCDGGNGSRPTPHRRRVRRSLDDRHDLPSGGGLDIFGRVDGGTNGAGCSRHASRAAGKVPGSSSDTHSLARQHPLGTGQAFTDALGQAYLSMLSDFPLDAYGAYASDVNRAYVASAAALYGMHGGGHMGGGSYYPGVMCPSGYPMGVCPLPHCSCKADPLSGLCVQPYLAAAACLQPRPYLPQWESQQLTPDPGQRDDEALAADAQLLQWLIEERNAEAMATDNRTGPQMQSVMPTAATVRAIGTLRADEGLRPAAHGLANLPIPGLEPPPLHLGRQQAWYGRDPRPAHYESGASGGPSPAATLSARGATGFGALAAAPLSLPLQASASAYYAALGIQPYGQLDLQYMAYQQRQQARILSELLGVDTYGLSKSSVPWATAASAAAGANGLGGAYLDRVRLPGGQTGVGSAVRQALAEEDIDAAADDQVGATADAGGTASADTDDLESFFSHEPPV